MNCLKRIAICGFAIVSLELSAAAQDQISTVAGGGPNGIPAVNANLFYPYETAVDTAGNVYIASSGQNRVFKISTAGTITVVAGNGTAGFGGDGAAATLAQLNSPYGVAVDTASPANVFITDRSNCVIRKVSQSSGLITTVAGKVTSPIATQCGYSGDGGAANAATLYYPQGIAVNPVNSDLYIADYSNGRVRKVLGGIATGTISTVAGGGGSSSVSNNCVGTAPYGDGAAASASYLCNPQTVALDSSVSPANVFVTEANRCDVREVVGSGGKIYLDAGSYTLGCGFTDNVVATSGQFNQAWQMHVSVSGSTTTVAVADYGNARIRQFTLTYAAGVPKPGTLTTIAGKGQGGYCGDAGPALNACMNPVGVAFDASGNIYIGDYGADRVRKITKSTGYISTIAGWGPNGGNEYYYSNPIGITASPGTGLSLYQPVGVFADPKSTTVYLGVGGSASDYALITSSGQVRSVAGNGVAGYAGDGTAASGAGTQVNYPTGFAKDTSGNSYIVDANNCAVRKISASSGFIDTIAGGYTGHLNGCGFSGNGGTAVNAQLYYPYAIAIDGNNYMYIAEEGYCDIRRVVLSTGAISTIAGIPGACGYQGDGGVATNAKLYYPYGVAVDGHNNLYIADTSSSRIRKMDAATHVITTVAGTGVGGYTGDGPAIGSSLYQPRGIAADPNGNLFIADYYNSIVRWVTPTGQMITFGGTAPGTPGGNYGFSGDGGLATSAMMTYPWGISQDPSGNFYIADYNNNRYRRITAFSGFGLSTANVTFETQPAGATSDYQEIMVSAIGPTTISSVSATSSFYEVDNCAGVTLTARQTCEIDVYFTPTTAGTKTGTVTISDSTTFSSQGKTISLTGTATGLTVTGSLAFGTELLNTSKTLAVTVKNTGAAVSLNGISLSPAGSNFSIVSGGTCPTGTGSLAAGASCTVLVKFLPTTVGAKRATLVINSSEAASPLLIPATGTGTSVSVSATSIAFTTITHGTNETTNLTVHNVGTASFTVSPSVAGTGAAAFSIATTGNTCTAAVAGGASCTLPVKFSPAAAQAYGATLTITTNGGYSNPTVALSGSGK